MVILLVLAVSAGLALRAQTSGSDRGDLVRVTVTVRRLRPSAPATLTAQDVLVYQRRERRPVVDWVPAQGQRAGLDLAILIDDSLSSQVAVQFSDLSSFLRSLPATTRVEIVYATHGNAQVGQPFTSDHEKAASALRIPVGLINQGSSIYMAVDDLAKHWPRGQNRRAALVISDGIDLYRGVTDSQPTLNPDLQQAIDDVHRTGVTVYALFSSGASFYTQNFFLVTNGQGSLGRLAFETGGEFFYQGFETPLAFSPYLNKLAQDLEQQYLLTFRALPGKQAGFEALRVTTEQPGVELIAPDHVYVPAAQ